MKIFVIGATKSGKTTTAKTLVQKLGCNFISASEWARDNFLPSEINPSVENYTKEITEWSRKHLKDDPDRCIKYIKKNNNLNKNCVIDGIRSPSDFIKLFDPKEDRVFFIDHDAHQIVNDFESGIYVIDEHMKWLIRNYFISPDQFFQVWVEKHSGLSDQIDKFIGLL